MSRALENAVKLQATSNIRAYGARGDGTTDDTAAIQSAINGLTSGGTLIVPPGTYRTTAKLNVNVIGIQIVGAGVGGNSKAGGSAGVVPTLTDVSASRIVGDFNGGAVIHISAQGCSVSGLSVGRSSTAWAAAYNVNDIGILVSAPDASGYQTVRNTTLRDLKVYNQPSEGVVFLDNIVNSVVSSVEVMCVKGSAFMVGTGKWLSKTNFAQPGIVTFDNCMASWIGGHALRIGGGAAEVAADDVPYRCIVDNMEAFYCCIVPAVCVVPGTPTTAFVSGFNHTLIGCAFGGRSEFPSVAPTHAALAVRGSNIKAINLRLVQTTSPAAYVYNDVPGYSTNGTRGVSFENVYAVNSLTGGAGYFNPLISVTSTVKGIEVICNQPDPTSLAAITALTPRGVGTQWLESLNGVVTAEGPPPQRSGGGSETGYAFLDAVTLADDAAGYFQWDGVTKGIVMVAGNSSAASTTIVAFRVGDGSAFATILGGATNVSVGTGTLSAGTGDGVDTDLNIHADTATNRLYIKNRNGGSYSYSVAFLATNTNAPGTGVVREFVAV